jgi:RNA polymerase sigma-70 factor (ECF subfamily)
MDDAGLLHRARRGDEPAFAELFGRFQRQVFRYAAYMDGADAADDVVQETFLAVLRQTGRHDHPTGSVAGYLIGIARHVIFKRHERMGGGLRLADVDDDAMLEVEPSTEPSALDQLVAAESVDVVRTAVQSLPAPYREAVVLCDLEDLDYAAAAALMDCPVGTVRSRLHRARALLAAKLGERA